MLKNTEGAINNGQSREEKLATQCHQDEEKQNKKRGCNDELKLVVILQEIRHLQD